MVSLEPEIALFLGAGASTVHKLPTTKDLRDELEDKYKSSDSIVNRLLDCDLLEDIEHVLQAIKDVDCFPDNPGWKYIKHELKLWCHVSSQFSTSNTSIVDDLKDAKRMLEKEVFDRYGTNSLDKDILKKTLGPFFHHFLFEEQLKFPIFTTNYDLVIEKFCAEENYLEGPIDGFQNRGDGHYMWTGNFQREFKRPSAVYLYKLHGSVNWSRTMDGKIERIGHNTLSPPSFGEEVMIYPTLSPKIGDEPPYSTIRKKFEDKIKDIKMLIVIGYSFRDEDISEKIKDNFIDNEAKKLVIISDNGIEDYHKLQNQDVPDNVTRVVEYRPTEHILILNEKLTPQSSNRLANSCKSFYHTGN